MIPKMGFIHSMDTFKLGMKQGLENQSKDQR
jgi:hypothetical protein